MTTAENSPRLRPATALDHDTIAEIWHASASLPGVGPADMPTRADLRNRVDEEFAAGWRVTLAVQGQEIVGFLATKPEERVLSELFVRPSATGRGIGQALLTHAKTAMPDGFTLFTRSANGGARRFYEREGLKQLREGAHPRSGDAITYYEWASSR